MKKIVIAAIVFFLAAVGIAWYIFTTRPIEDGTNDDTGGLTEPFGGSAQDAPPSPNQATDDKVTLSQLTQVFKEPVAGAAFVSGQSASNAVRFIERATGHIYEVSLADGLLSRISNTTIPKIYESLWLNGNNTILRHLAADESTIRSYSAKLAKAVGTSTNSTIQGNYLPENITAVAASPGGARIFYMAEVSSGSQGSVSNPDGTKKSVVFSSKISEWRVQWPSDNTIALTTKAAAGADGFLYFMTLAGSQRRVLGNVDGLVSLVNPQTTYVAYSDNLPILRLFNVKNGQSVITDVSTIADKCVWSKKQSTLLYCAVPSIIPTAQYPHEWYQGLVSFSDDIYRIDATTGRATLMGSLRVQFDKNIDAIDVALSATEDYLSFTNKKDLSLWLFKLSQ